MKLFVLKAISAKTGMSTSGSQFLIIGQILCNFYSFLTPLSLPQECLPSTASRIKQFFFYLESLGYSLEENDQGKKINGTICSFLS